MLFFSIYAHEDTTPMNLKTYAAHRSAISILFMSVDCLRPAISGSDGFATKGLILLFFMVEELQHMLSPLECLHDATQGAL